MYGFHFDGNNGYLDERMFLHIFEEDVNKITSESSISARDNPGGTAPGRVAAALAEAKKTLEAVENGF